MRKINESLITSTSAMFYKQGTWTHLQKAYIEAFAESIKSLIGSTYSTTKVYVLNGCVNSTSGSTYTISAGSVFYNGEIYLVDATTFTVTTGTAVATIVTTQNTTDYNADPCLFSDGTYKNVHDIRKIVIAEAVSGSGVSNYANFDFYPYSQNYVDISDSVSVGASFTGTPTVRKYFDGTIEVTGTLNFASTVTAPQNLLTGLPVPYSIFMPVTIYVSASGNAYQNVGLNSSGQLRTIDDIVGTGLVSFCFTYKLG